jgi:hypothetical protein
MRGSDCKDGVLIVGTHLAAFCSNRLYHPAQCKCCLSKNIVSQDDEQLSRHRDTVAEELRSRAIFLGLQVSLLWT